MNRAEAPLSRTSLLLGALLLGSAPAALAQSIAFDLVDINDVPGPEHPGIDFTFHRVSPFSAEAGGIAAVDFDNDGWTDLFFADTEGHPNHLYVNQGDGTFSEEGAARGVALPNERGGNSLFVDMENDGDLDLLLFGYPNLGESTSKLYSLHRNNGAPSWDFTDVTTSAGGFPLAPTVAGTDFGEPGGACAGDVDGNGYVDFFATYWIRALPGPIDQPRLFENFANPDPPTPGQTDYSPRVFVDATIEAGFDVSYTGSMGRVWWWMPSLVDVDRDGDLDLRINIEWGTDLLRLNDGHGVFAPDSAAEVGYAGGGDPPEERNEMGVAWGDPDNDLDLDSYHTNSGDFVPEDDCFYRNDSSFGLAGAGLSFTEIAHLNGTAKSTKISWGCLFVDLDNDRDEDLAFTSGLGNLLGTNWVLENLYPVTTPGLVSPSFRDVSDLLPDCSKLAQPDAARALVQLDYDRDGDLDLVVGRQGVPLFTPPGVNPSAGFFRNDTPGMHGWLTVLPLERFGSRNTIGARIFMKSGGADGLVQMREVIAGSSFLAQEPYRKHFGLGGADPDWVVVRWMNGKYTVAESVSADTDLTVPADHYDSMDLNGDGHVNGVDAAILELYLRRPKAVVEALHPWPVEILADVNGDGAVDALDETLLLPWQSKLNLK